MANRTSPALRQYGAALRTLLLLTVILGLAYPLAMTGFAQVAFGNNANGSLVQRDGKTVGSDLIGQGFTRPVLENGQPQKDANGNPVVEADPKYFQSRPSAAGTGYDPTSSGASNLGPENTDLIALINQRRATAAALDGVNPAQVAPDALLASGSGLDPDISPAYAQEQIARVARVRGLSVAQVQGLVTAHPRHNEERQRAGTVGRGEFRIYLGAAPGVGKTYAMLDEGHRRAERGADVVVGFVETHGRAATAQQVEGMEVVPRVRRVTGGIEVDEFD